jgi:hypothetical protein
MNIVSFLDFCLWFVEFKIIRLSSLLFAFILNEGDVRCHHKLHDEDSFQLDLFLGVRSTTPERDVI